jgi:hypothetical protein
VLTKKTHRSDARCRMTQLKMSSNRLILCVDRLTQDLKLLRRHRTELNGLERIGNKAQILLYSKFIHHTVQFAR